MEKLAGAGVPRKFLGLIVAMLKEGKIALEDGVSELPPFPQTTGVAQGDNLSPLLFSVLLGDLPSTLKARHELVEVIMYADDLVLLSRSRRHLKESIGTLEQISQANGLSINVGKTKVMKFGSGGPSAAGDTFWVCGQRVEKVKRFCYLGLELATRGVSSSRHISERTAKARLAFRAIPAPQRLSLRTAVALFNIKIAPIATYGIQVIWPHLKRQQLEALDRLKAAYLKRVLGVHRSARNRLVYLVSGVPLLTEDLARRYALERTAEFERHRERWAVKMSEVDPEFFSVPAMSDRRWEEPECRYRHRVTRGATHGFHHLICRTEGIHDPGDKCICRLCAQRCNRYHIYRCKDGSKFDWSDV